MKKRVICAVLVAALAVSVCFSLVACSDDSTASADNTTNIVYLGDSIAEALIGPSPLSERDNYGYYALVGRTNGFNYYNHSVSGHKTDDLRKLLEDLWMGEDASLMLTHIKQADIIHVSILGNNALQYDLGEMMIAVADPNFENNFKDSIIDRMVNGGGFRNKDGTVYSFPFAQRDMEEIVWTLREFNPDAKIVFQNVYNPVFEGTVLLPQATATMLAGMTDDGRFGAEGEKITTVAQYRAIANVILGYLNGVLDTYLQNNPGSIEIIDAFTAFNAVADADETNGYNGASAGRALIFPDWVHPSNIGHALLARLTQDKLVSWDMASTSAVDEYKKIRLDQIARMYTGVDGFDATAAIAAINGAQTYQDVSDAYFTAIDGVTPKWC